MLGHLDASLAGCSGHGWPWGKTQDNLEGLCLLAGLRMPQNPPEETDNVATQPRISGIR